MDLRFKTKKGEIIKYLPADIHSEERGNSAINFKENVNFKKSKGD